MKQIRSIQIQLNKPLTIRETLGLHTIDKHSSCNVYVLYDHRKICLEQLSKLVVFSLTCNKNKSITIIVEGKDPSTVVIGIQKLLEPVAKTKPIQVS